MKRLKRALSITKSAPRIEESISEVDEYLKETHLEEASVESLLENGGFRSGHLGNNNTSTNTHAINIGAANTQSVLSNDSGHGSDNEQDIVSFSPVRYRPKYSEKKAWEVRMKRMSLPVNLEILENAIISPKICSGMTRKERRVSMSEMGYGKIRLVYQT